MHARQQGRRKEAGQPEQHQQEQQRQRQQGQDQDQHEDDGDGDGNEQEEAGSTDARGRDPKITLSRDKSFFRRAAIATYPLPLFRFLTCFFFFLLGAARRNFHPSLPLTLLP